MTKQKFYGIISAMIAVIIWGSVFPVKEYLLNYISPLTINFFNALITSVVYLFFVVFSKKNLKIGNKAILKLILAGIIGISITRIACDMGINSVGGVMASVFSSLIPVMCILFDCLFYKKFPNRVTLLSIVISVLGILMVIGIGAYGQIDILGYVFLFVSNCAWIYYCYLSSDLKKISSSVSMFYQFLGSTVFLCPSLFITKIDYDLMLNTDIIFCILFLGIANGVIAYGLFSIAIKIIGVLSSNIINNFIPVVTLIIGIMFGERIIISQILGVILIIFSILCITIYNKRSDNN